MMERNRDWTDRVRSELREAEMAPPAGGWERLRRELAAAEPARRPQGRAVLLRRLRIAAAVAAVLLGAVVGERWMRTEGLAGMDSEFGLAVAEGGGDSRDRRTDGVSPARHPAEDALARLAPGGSVPQPAVTPEPRPDAPLRDHLRNTTFHAAATLPAADGASENPAAAATGPSEVPAAATAAADGTVGREASRRSRNGIAARVPAGSGTAGEFVAQARPRLRGRTSLGLFASGGVAGDGGSGIPGSRVMASDLAPMVGNGDNMALMLRDSYRQSTFRHHQPLGFGLSIRKEFAHGLSLESGVVYTLLRSDVQMRFAAEEMSQQLHFIGLPLRMNWQFLRRGGFILYIGMGGMAEWCASAKLGSERVEEHGTHWSAFGTVGAEYRFGRVAGLYVEPECTWYLTETALQTVRNETPLHVTLRLGVRFSF